MCYPVQCAKCGKTTWAGCGLHKDMVMSKIPPENRCTCPREGEAHPAPAAPAPAAAAPSEYAKHIHKDEDFKAAFDSATKPVVIDFYGITCMPCKMMAPKFEALAKEYDGKAIFMKVCGDECPKTMEEFEVFAYPTFQIYKDKKLVDEVTGASEAKLRDIIKKNIN